MTILPTHKIQDNIFGFTQPEQLTCHIFDYYLGRNLMTVEVMDRPKDSVVNLRKIIFSDVTYFSGVMSWRGANIELLPLSESLSMARKLGLISLNEADEIQREMPDPDDCRSMGLPNVYRIRGYHPTPQSQHDGHPAVEVVICASNAELVSE
jgi:hypothetical protein